MKTEFPRNYLAAASHFMADHDVHYYLIGVFVEILPNETRLVATDGVIAGVLRHSIENSACDSVIVPAATVAIAMKMASEVLSLERDDAGVWRLSGLPFVPVEGVFPPYRRIIVTQPSGVAGDFDPALIARFAKAGKSLKRKDVPIIRQNGKGSALVHFYAFDNFVGIISPLRMFTEKMPDLGIPTWAAV